MTLKELGTVEDNNIFRIDNKVIYRLPDNRLITYDIKIKQWDTPDYESLISKDVVLKSDEFMSYIFRGTYLGEFISRYRAGTLTSSYLIFLYPKYEFILEQGIKLNLPFVFFLLRDGLFSNLNTTSLSKASSISIPQLKIIQEFTPKLGESLGFYFNRIMILSPNLKGIQPEIFKKICKIALNDSLTNDDLQYYNDNIMTSKEPLSKRLDKVIRYLGTNYMEYRRLRETLVELELANDYPQFPKIEDIDPSITKMVNKINELTDEEKYRSLNNQYSKFIDYISKFEFVGDKYSIIKPTKVQDLDIEGNTLHHCVGGYKNNIATGKEIILFLRKNSDLDSPYYTIDLDKDGFIRQIHTFYNGNLSKDKNKEELFQFLQDWANNKSDLINKKSLKLNYSPLGML